MSCALLLADAGHEVRVFDRFEMPAPVGSGLLLQPPGIAVLRAMGRLNELRQLAAPVDRIFGESIPAHKVVLDVRYSALGADEHALGVHRSALFDVLHRAMASLGVPVTSGTDIVDWATDGGRWFIDARGARHGPFELLIDASGANSALKSGAGRRIDRRLLDYGALWGTFNWPDGALPLGTLSQRYVGAHTMVGAMPIGLVPGSDSPKVAFFWSLRRDALDAWQARGLDAWKSDVLAIWPDVRPILDQIDDPGQLTFAAYGHHTLRRPFADGILYAGDAAHSTSPQLGQGANMALLDAVAIAAAVRLEPDAGEAAMRYAAARRRHVRIFQLASYLLTGFYQSDSRLLAAMRDATFGPLSRLPLMRRIVAGLVSGTLVTPIRQ